MSSPAERSRTVGNTAAIPAIRSSFELFDEGGKTRLRLTHVGLETFAPETNPDFARGNFLADWTALTDLLKDFLASA